ncbi:MAG: tRNA (uridine(34)/cytosine(34)/5-carboxymethylaminomethyluridine(34)-2'-O)-methyltransferase TrmL [Gammaproteobacteria bacterium]|jgi:tRNA (cytidine/uridine-2'-O-)-methyltransferase|nr:tRNA (uridine(34)/cytosine(34)/5-carboxymethylaminomethyluridine(34)-2'-O)-methyltransferase TrmL [Gammaproteobacteria bacterium]
MFHVILLNPEIPANTGNIIRLCANTGSELHLIRPLGFEMDDARLRRAGLDYHEYARVHVHDNLEACLEATAPPRLFACSTRGGMTHANISYRRGDAFLFGPETRGLPPDVLARIPPEFVLRIPMMPGNRSINLSNAVAVMVYEAWRQQDFAGSGAAG